VFAHAYEGKRLQGRCGGKVAGIEVEGLVERLFCELVIVDVAGFTGALEVGSAELG
jgi:hypothetical protein